MPANRFFYPGPLVQDETIQLTEAEHHHLRVMRIETGEEVEIINGKGALATATLIEMQKHSASCQIVEVVQHPSPKRQCALVIPLMRPSKLEWIVEKATELGADVLSFYAADFSEKIQLSSNQLERLHNLCLSALKQSGRLYLPMIEEFPSLQRAMIEEATYYFGDTTGDGISLLKAPCGPHRTALITGPERGFSPKELELLARSAQGVSLSAHILRAETAPIAGISLLALKNLT